MGINVYAPDKAVELYQNAYYIIANVDCNEEMKQQLLALGVSQERIIVCSNYDFMLKKVLIPTYRG